MAAVDEMPCKSRHPEDVALTGPVFLSRKKPDLGNICHADCNPA
jgi:hypothetical protein